MKYKGGELTDNLMICQLTNHTFLATWIKAFLTLLFQYVGIVKTQFKSFGVTTSGDFNLLNA